MPLRQLANFRFRLIENKTDPANKRAKQKPETLLNWYYLNIFSILGTYL